MADRIVFSAPEQPVASVILIAWRSAPHLDACLRALATQVTDTSYEVVLILNEPDDDLVTYVTDTTSGIRTITTRVNVGYGGAVNLGAERAKGEFIILLNDDTEVLAGWLGPLIATARRRPRAAVVGSTTLFPDGTIQEAGSVVWADGTTVKVGRDLPGGSTAFDFERRVDHCSGTSLLVRKTSWDAIGGMDAEAYYPAYYEDTDFCLRIIAAGEEVWYQPRSYIRHLESASTNSSFRTFLFERNGEVFRNRWSDELKGRVHPTDRDETQIATAVWRAMGAPLRVLVVDEQPAAHLGLFTALQADDRCHLTAWSPTGIGDNTALCEMGVGVARSSEIVDGCLLGRESGYDAVFVVQPELLRQRDLMGQVHGADGGIVTFADGAPSLDALVVHHDGELASITATSWLAIVEHQLQRLTHESA